MNNKYTYFGAANGFSGFRSNFGKIFSPYVNDKLFIIKGGPGTGKSTLMRRIYERYSEAYDVTTVLCSSDPKSLDGLLIKNGKYTVGVVDGTAPHVVEPLYPGSVEEIINLGDSFDCKALTAAKSEIVELSERKKEHYKRAYDSLKIAGDIYEYVTSNFLKCSCYSEAEKIFIEFGASDKDSKGTCERSDFWIGAFCKNGYKRLNVTDKNRRYVKVKGDGISEYALLSELSAFVQRSRINALIYSSALSQDLTDAVMTDTCNYIISNSSEYDVDSTLLAPRNREYERLLSSYKCFIDSAQISLIKASEYHFKLEEIYTEAMSFEKNESKYKHILDTLDSIFDK